MKKQKDEFFVFMDELLAEFPHELRPEHVTIQRVMQEAEIINKSVTYKQAFKLLRQKEQQGRLRYLGRMKNPNGGSATHAWEIV